MSDPESPTRSEEWPATTRVVCQQVAPFLGDLPRNRELSLAAVRSAVARGANVVVLPELVTSGYLFGSRAEAAACAIAEGDELFAQWGAALSTSGRIAIGGFCEQGEGGRLYNSVAVVAVSGVIATYRKTHLWDREKLIFDAGNQSPFVVDTAVGRIGVLICYDLEFPEMPRILALQGVELIAVPTNWPLLDRPVAEHPPEVLAAMVAARTNRVVVACCDRTGTERGQRWTEGTVIVNEEGWIAARPDIEGIAVADVDLARTRDKTISEHNDAIADRRPELYGTVVTPGRQDRPSTSMSATPIADVTIRPGDAAGVSLVVPPEWR